MASMSEEENIPEETGRRTRSGRKMNTTVPIVTARATRRSTRNKTIEVEIESEPLNKDIEEEEEQSIEYQPQTDIISEMLIEAAQGVIHDTNIKYSKPEEEEEEEEHQDEIQENTVIESDFHINDSEVIRQIPESDQENNLIMQVDDEKSSSFPFGNIPTSENSDGKTEENIPTNIGDCVDSSLLASLAGDNANSLPSAGEESQHNSEFGIEGRNIGELNPTEGEESQCEIVTAEESQSDVAIAEDLPNGIENLSEKTSADVDAEMVSEDELPAPPEKPEVKDAEEVSDDELPAPKRAELPADTEVVSEDELPSSGKKDGAHIKRKVDETYNPSSPTEESTDIPEKKQKLDEIDKDDDLKDKKKDKDKEKEKEKKKLPELDKYWKSVNDDPADFTGWTYLLQYVDQENDIEAAREAYDAFLSHYPYCYGYWRKYADYEKRKGSKKKCEEVFERGLQAIPLSVDLWIHYLSHVKVTYPDDEEYIRTQFTRALDACGLEFRSDKLWEAFIKWEMDAKRYSNVVKIYDRLLGIPTQGYNGHFESFQDLINNHSPTVTLSVEEFKQIRAEIRESELKQQQQKEQNDKLQEDEEPNKESEVVTVPADDVDMNEADDHVRNEEELEAIRDRIIASRRKIHKATIAAVTCRWTYEEGIKRPYFHVKPLERCQLKNWKEYLDFEIEKGDRERILILFERCLIACALYDDFWLKLIRYLESQNDPELVSTTRDAYERACTIHHPDKPSLHLMWSAFEECHGNFIRAAEVLQNIEKVCPNLLQISYRRINLERRRGDYTKCEELYEHYITGAKNKNISGSLSIKYARFCHKILGDLDKGFEILQQALERDPCNARVALQMIDIALQREKVNEEEIVEIMDKFMARESMDPDQKVLFAQRKVEFLEDFGSTAKGLQDAQRALQIALTKANEMKKKSESSPSRKSTKDNNLGSNSTTNTLSSSGSISAPSTYNTTNYTYPTGTSTTAGAAAATGYYGNSQSYQSYDGYSYNHWQYGSSYSGGYGQWSGYGNYY